LKVGAIRALAKNVMRDVVEIGRHLSEAKAKFGRGDNPEFLAWAKDALGWSQASVYRFLNVHDLAQRGDFITMIKSDLDLRSLYTLAAADEDVQATVIEAIAESGANGERKSLDKVRTMRTSRSCARGGSRSASPRFAPVSIAHLKSAHLKSARLSFA
jgi:hypothetical protein